MSKLGNSRLLELADHLESTNRGHDKFNFGLFSNIHHNNILNNPCGTAGCALGECPFAFPVDWIFRDGIPVLIENNRITEAFGAACKYFDINMHVASHLFSPGSQNPNVYGGKVLNHLATPQEVAHNIREFVKQNISLWDKAVLFFKAIIH